MSKLDSFLTNNGQLIDDLNADCYDNRRLFGSGWEAKATLTETKPDEDNASHENELVVLCLFVDEEEDELVAKYAINREIYGVGVKERDFLVVHGQSTPEQAYNWFEKHSNAYRLTEASFPAAAKFFEQTNQLISKL